MDDNYTALGMIQLKLTVRAAALPACRQIENYPSFCVVADEIVLDYGNWCSWALNGHQAPQLTSEQRASLTALDEQMTAMSNEHNPDLWTDEALQSNPK